MGRSITYIHIYIYIYFKSHMNVCMCVLYTRTRARTHTHTHTEPFGLERTLTYIGMFETRWNDRQGGSWNQQKRMWGVLE